MSNPWAGAESLSDIAGAVVDFLEGRVDFTPVHNGPPDEETSADTASLVRLNRAGFVTLEAQPGCNGQRAYVDGLISLELMERAENRFGDSELVLMHGAPLNDAWLSIPVTLDEDLQPVTWIGQISAEETIEWFVHHCGEQIRTALEVACPVTAFDPSWGRNDRLLPELLAVLEGVS